MSSPSTFRSKMDAARARAKSKRPVIRNRNKSKVNIPLPRIARVRRVHLDWDANGGWTFATFRAQHARVLCEIPINVAELYAQSNNCHACRFSDEDRWRWHEQDWMIPEAACPQLYSAPDNHSYPEDFSAVSVPDFIRQLFRPLPAQLPYNCDFILPPGRAPPPPLQPQPYVTNRAPSPPALQQQPPVVNRAPSASLLRRTSNGERADANDDDDDDDSNAADDEIYFDASPSPFHEPLDITYGNFSGSNSCSLVDKFCQEIGKQSTDPCIYSYGTLDEVTVLLSRLATDNRGRINVIIVAHNVQMVDLHDDLRKLVRTAIVVHLFRALDGGHVSPASRGNFLARACCVNNIIMYPYLCQSDCTGN